MNSTYTDLLLQRTETLIRNWSAYISGDKEIQEAYPLDYLSTNLIEQIQRINRLKLSNEKVDELCLSYRSLFENNKFTLISSAIKGAEPISLLSLFENTVNNIHWALEKDEDSDSEFEIYDQLSDCLVKRDDLFLVENYVRKFLNDFSSEENKTIQDLFNQMLKSLLKIDKSFKDNIEVFTLTEKFCRNYTASNRLFDEEIYWWFYEPIHKCEEIGIVSLMTLKQFFVGKETKDDVIDLSASLNAKVQFTRLSLEGKNTTQEDGSKNILPFPEAIVREPQEEHAYALAAKSGVETNLQNAVYVLVIHKEKNSAIHHQLTSTLGNTQESKKYFDDDIIKIVNDTVPRIANAKFGIPSKKFSIDLHTSTEGCSGKSIGVAILIEYLHATKFLANIEVPIAVTGEINVGGDILHVESIELKAQHAIDCGFQIIFIPDSNKNELPDKIKQNVAIKFVSNVKEVYAILLNHGKEIEKSEEKSLKELNRWRSIFTQKSFEVSEVKQSQWSDSITVTGHSEKVQIIIDRKKNGEVGRPRLQGSSKTGLYKEISELLNADEDLITFSYTHEKVSGKINILNNEIRKHLQEYLLTIFGRDVQEKQEQSCVYRFDIGATDKVIVKQYTSGTLFVEGAKGELWNKVKDAIELISSQKLEVSSKEDSKKDYLINLPPDVTKWIGVDEAGKGDYFGPLVTAAVLVDESNKEKFYSIGIKDSKNLSDQRNIEIGELIASICKDKCYVLVTMPEKYNQLLSSSFNGNSQNLLGWQHRRAMENVLLKHECQWAICDQFGNESFINEGLKTGKGSQITIIQRPKAESNIAVAAASILARREFLLRLQKMSEEFKVTFPKGSSDNKTIIAVAEILIKKSGKDILNKVAKTHFKTTKMILGGASKK